MDYLFSYLCEQQVRLWDYGLDNIPVTERDNARARGHIAPNYSFLKMFTDRLFGPIQDNNHDETIIKVERTTTTTTTKAAS